MPSIIHRKFSYSFNYVTFVLAAVNVIVFIITGSGRNSNWTYLLGLQPHLCIKGRFYWQVFTYMFMHGSWSHLLSNMLGLFFFGIFVERQIGSKEFLLFYLLCGTVCGAASLGIYVLTGYWGIVLVGASGAVYAVLLLFAVIFPRSSVFIFGLIPVPAPLLIIIYAGIAVFDEVFGLKAGVAHLTHLSGFAAAWIYCLIRFGVNPVKVWKNALR